jgi:hypothetical protein
MDWDNLRGSAIGQTNKPPLNIKLLEYKIYQIVNMDLEPFISKVNISNNSYGKWITK